MPTFRLGLVAAAAAEGDDVIREAIDASYRESVEPWKQVYTTVLQARGLQLRPGITLDDFATILTAIVDGLALRAVGDAESDVIDDGQPRSPLGTAALALVYACLERIEDESELTLEQVVSAMVRDPTMRQTWPLHP